MRKAVDPAARGEMCRRLIAFLETAYGRHSDREIARLMGYSNSTTLAAVRRLEAFPDVEKLRALVAIPLQGRLQPNIHWLIVGTGPALIRLIGDDIDAGMSLEEYAADLISNIVKGPTQRT